MLLEVRALEAHYGGIRAVKGIDLEVGERELVCLIGANGAGKTTTLKAICRLLPSSGKITYAGSDITHAKVHELPRRGLVMVPEGRGIFPQLTVEENLAMGAYVRGHVDAERQYATFPRLKERRTQVAGTLSGGEQQMLATARALMFEAKLLAIDEPSLGLAPKIREELFAAIRKIHAEGVTVLLVEQEVAQVFKMAGRNYVLSQGRILAEGSGTSLMADETLRAGYLGL